MSKTSQRKLSAAQKAGRVPKKETTIAEDFDKIGEGAWDDLNRLYGNCLAVTTTPAATVPLLRNGKLLEKVRDIEQLKKDATILVEDMRTSKEALDQIHSRHVNYTGSATDEHQLAEVLQLSEAYQHWASEYENTVMDHNRRVLQHFVVDDDLEEKGSENQE